MTCRPYYGEKRWKNKTRGNTSISMRPHRANVVSLFFDITCLDVTRVETTNNTFDETVGLASHLSNQYQHSTSSLHFLSSRVRGMADYSPSSCCPAHVLAWSRSDTIHVLLARFSSLFLVHPSSALSSLCVHEI